MKRLVITILALSLLLSGCATVKLPPDSSASSNTHISSTPEQLKPSSEFTLMDNAEKIGQIGNLSYLANNEIEAMQAPEMRLFGDALLLWSSEFDDSGCRVICKSISLRNGALLGEWILENSSFVTIQTGENSVGVCDAEQGVVYILDSTLNEIQRYMPEKLGQTWYLSGDLNTLYQIDWENGVYQYNLTAGTTQQLLEHVTDVYERNQTDSRLLLTYTDLDNERTTCKMLDLQSGALEPLPIDSTVSSAVMVDNVWLLGDSFRWGIYYIIAGDQKRTALWQENRFDLLPQGHLLTVADDSLSIALYHTDGSFLSKCEVPEDQALYIGADMVWSDLWNGYFLIGVQEDQAGKLMFWDIDADVSGEDFPLQEEAEAGGISADAALYTRAKEIGDRYGVKILIADQCSLVYDQFSAYEVYDSQSVTQGLDLMEKALSRYPDGYFEQLKFGTIQDINFELVGGLQQDDSSVYSESYAGITMEQPECYTVVLDVYFIGENNIYHEITHMTDGKLAWDAMLREDALFSEEAWNTLQPNGFTYAETYADLSDSDIQQYIDSGYFVNEYACRYATEDRAMMVESAIMDNDYIFELNPHLIDKLAYYSQCIRDSFNTDGWPETTAWEAVLQRIPG